MFRDKLVVKTGMVCSDYHTVLTGQEFGAERPGLPSQAVVLQARQVGVMVGNLGPPVLKQRKDWEGGRLPGIGYISLIGHPQQEDP